MRTEYQLFFIRSLEIFSKGIRILFKYIKHISQSPGSKYGQWVCINF